MLFDFPHCYLCIVHAYIYNTYMCDTYIFSNSTGNWIPKYTISGVLVINEYMYTNIIFSPTDSLVVSISFHATVIRFYLPSRIINFSSIFSCKYFFQTYEFIEWICVFLMHAKREQYSIDRVTKISLNKKPKATSRKFASTLLAKI